MSKCYKKLRFYRLTVSNQDLVKHLCTCSENQEYFSLPNSVENIDEDEEEGDEQRHPARDDLGRDEEGDPGDDDEEHARPVDLEDHLVALPAQHHAEAARGVIA